jgi:hypothetical protein
MVAVIKIAYFDNPAVMGIFYKFPAVNGNDY